uniref:glucuronate isomerase n=1 Tax=Pararhizobium sp. IMCC3301 TaxID=3067904 RepID=UPI002741872E|nr:glucuronate isomerase [Pararhizobium sp. IMCC3301]
MTSNPTGNSSGNPSGTVHLPPTADTIYQHIRDLPIVSPHGHCDPAWFAENSAFRDPAELLIIPDHYVFRMLYSQGVPLQDLGIGVDPDIRDPRRIFQIFAQHWDRFLGTPSRQWLEHTFTHVFQISEPLTAQTADYYYDLIDAQLKTPQFRPRALFERFGLELLATTDAALDTLSHHQKIRASGWQGRIIPTFRPDTVLNPAAPDFAAHIRQLGELTGEDTASFASYLNALRQRRAFFKSEGATATDHAITTIHTCDVPDTEMATLLRQALQGPLSHADATRFYGRMLIEMAQMSVDDGLVMQIHGGSSRSTNAALYQRFGNDMGADIPIAVDWVNGLSALLNRVGNDPALSLILFTLDETTYSRELAPMAGHWPALRLGPPWWFHDSLNGIARYFDTVVETAGYWNLAGFNDDTRALLSIPARHDLWRRGAALHLGGQISRGLFGLSDALDIARLLARDLAVDAYRLKDL